MGDPPRQTAAGRHLLLLAHSRGRPRRQVRGGGEALTAASARSYRNLATEHEALMQKYLHLLQIVETEKTVAKQLRQQIEDGEIEIERLKAEVKSPASPRRCAAAPRGDPAGCGRRHRAGGDRGADVTAGGICARFNDVGLTPSPAERGEGIAFVGGFSCRSHAEGLCAALAVVPVPGTRPWQGRVHSSSEHRRAGAVVSGAGIRVGMETPHLINCLPYFHPRHLD